MVEDKIKNVLVIKGNLCYSQDEVCIINDKKISYEKTVINLDNFLRGNVNNFVYGELCKLMKKNLSKMKVFGVVE
jgi:hypothetical protein